MSAKQTASAAGKSLSATSAKPSFNRIIVALAAALLLVSAVPAWAGVKPATLTAADRADILRIQAYMNGIKTMQARFLQASSGGDYAEGTLTLSRPGKMRIEYDPPVQQLIVADGTWLIYHDKELEQMTHLPLGSTPADILVQDNLSLLGDDPVITHINRGKLVIALTVARQESDGESLTFIFSDKPLALKKWVVADAQGARTSVSLLNTRFGIAVDEGLFHLRLLQPKNRESNK